MDEEQKVHRKNTYSGVQNSIERLFWAGNQGNHQNFDPSLLAHNCWLVFMGMEQKNFFFASSPCYFFGLISRKRKFLLPKDHHVDEKWKKTSDLVKSHELICHFIRGYLCLYRLNIYLVAYSMNVCLPLQNYCKKLLTLLWNPCERTIQILLQENRYDKYFVLFFLQTVQWLRGQEEVGRWSKNAYFCPRSW